MCYPRTRVDLAVAHPSRPSPRWLSSDFGGGSAVPCGSLVRVRDEELHWVAGLLEGEGCFTPKSRKLRDRTSFNPLIQVTSTDRDVLERLVSLVGGRIGGPYPTRRETHRPTYQWQFAGERARELMVLVRPLMFERRQKQIDIAIDKISQSRAVLDDRQVRINAHRERLGLPGRAL